MPASLLHAAIRLPASLAQALFAPRWLGLFLLVFGLGLVLPKIILAACFDSDAHDHAAAAALLGSFLVNLLCVGVALSLRGAPREAEWPVLRVVLRCAALALAGCVGLRLSDATVLGWSTALALGLLTAAQCAAIAGCGALLDILFGARAAAGRALLALLVALAATGLFWTKHVLEVAYERDPGLGRMATQATLSFGPSTGLAAVWNESEVRFDLVRRPLTYDLWLGNDLSWNYPMVGPERQLPAGSVDVPKVLNPGLALGLAAWGLCLTVLADLLGIAARAARSPGDSPRPVPAAAS